MLRLALRRPPQGDWLPAGRVTAAALPTWLSGRGAARSLRTLGQDLELCGGPGGIGRLAGQAVVCSQTPKFCPLFHSTGELITTAPAAVPVVVSMTWWVVHGPRRVP
jgi:hypothetical protein